MFFGAGVAGVAPNRAGTAVVRPVLVLLVLVGFRFATLVVVVTALVERRSRVGSWSNQARTSSRVHRFRANGALGAGRSVR